MSEKTIQLIVANLILLVVTTIAIYTVMYIVGLNEELDTLNNKLFASEMERRSLENDIDALMNGEWLAVKVEATGYAPLDPEAVEGMCYSGDPTITAGNFRSDPNRTVAMGRSYPYGTRVYIPGVGNRVVEDRGGMITDGHIDIMFATKKEALAFGRQLITIYIKSEVK